MRVQVLTDFKDGYESFKAGEVREIDDDRAKVFAGYGWVEVAGVTAEAAPAAATLNIHSARLGVSNRGI